MDPRNQFVLMATAALVDGELGWEEQAILNAYARDIGIDKTDAKEMLAALSNGRRVSAAAPDDEPTRLSLYKRLVEVVMADGKLMRSELHFLRQLAPTYEVSSAQLREWLGRARSLLFRRPTPAPRSLPGVLLLAGWPVALLAGMGLLTLLTASVLAVAGLTGWAQGPGPEWAALLAGLGAALWLPGAWLWWRARRLHRGGIPAVAIATGEATARGKLRYRFYHEGERLQGACVCQHNEPPQPEEGFWILIDPAAPHRSKPWWRVSEN